MCPLIRTQVRVGSSPHEHSGCTNPAANDCCQGIAPERAALTILPFLPDQLNIGHRWWRWRATLSGELGIETPDDIGQHHDRAQVVIDGQIYPLAGTQCGAIGEGEINLLILSDGANQIAYAVQNVVDTIHIANAVVPEVKKGEIEGVTLFDGEALEVLDCHWLFAQHAGDSHQKISKTCQINEDDPWVRSILRPMVEAAGYKIVGADSTEAVDVAITMSDQPTAPRHAGQVITLTNDPEAADHKGGVIYRYDRGTLLASLTETRRKAS